MKVDDLFPWQLEALDRVLRNRPNRLDESWLCPWLFFEHKPDSWQTQALVSLVTKSQDILMLISRQLGKTETVSLAAYILGCLGGFVLIVSPSDRQSLEFMRRVRRHHSRIELSRELRGSAHELELAGGGRVLALPNSADKIRVYDAITLLVIDEAARVPDDLYAAVTPMLAISNGATALLSTPKGKRGFFYREFVGEGSARWNRFKHTWEDCPRYTAEFIEQERKKHGDWYVRQEYCCEFLDNEMALFNMEAIEECLVSEMSLGDW